MRKGVLIAIGIGALFAAPLIIVFGGWLVLGYLFSDRSTYPSPTQPDPAIARSLQQELAGKPGIARPRVDLTITCIDRCKGQRYEFKADIEVKDDISAEQLLDINRTINQFYPRRLPPVWQKVPGDIRYSLHSPGGEGLSLHTANAEALTPASYHGTSTLTATMADGFLTAARANPDTGAEWSTEPDGGTPTFTVTSAVEPSTCDALDEDAKSSVTALAAVRRSGIPAVLQFSCEGGYGSAPIGPDTHTTGWSSMAASLSRLMKPVGTGGNADHRAVLRPEQGKAVVSVTYTTANTPASVRRDAESIVEQLRTMQVPSPTLDWS